MKTLLTRIAFILIVAAITITWIALNPVKPTEVSDVFIQTWGPNKDHARFEEPRRNARLPMWVLHDKSRNAAWGFVKMSNTNVAEHLTKTLGYKLVPGGHLATYVYDYGTPALYSPEDNSFWDMSRKVQLSNEPKEFVVAIELK
jgi:hypothetical protein